MYNTDVTVFYYFLQCIAILCLQHLVSWKWVQSLFIFARWQAAVPKSRSERLSDLDLWPFDL